MGRCDSSAELGSGRGIFRAHKRIGARDRLNKVVMGEAITENSASRNGRPPNSLLVAALRLAIRGYQAFLSPLMVSGCRYHPSCSHYAYEAIEVHGPGRGMWLAITRLLRCHPFSRGGIDLVPPGCNMDVEDGDHTHIRNRADSAGRSQAEKSRFDMPVPTRIRT